MKNFEKCTLKVTSNIINLDENGKPDGDIENDEFTVPGLIKKDDNKLIISYKEARNGTSVLCEITSSEKETLVKRRGDVVCDMCFAIGKTCKTLYSAPPFSFDMAIDTARIENKIEDGFGFLSLFYTMTIGGAKKRCRMKISLV